MSRLVGLMLILICIHCQAGTGQQNWRVEPVLKDKIFPIFIKYKYCVDKKTCLSKNNVFVDSTEKEIRLAFFGISDEKAIKEIMATLFSEDIAISSIVFYEDKFHHGFWFFNKKIVIYSNVFAGG